MDNVKTLKQKQTVRNGKIELLRFIFALFIACYHLGCSVKFPEELFQRGYLAVEFYFVVSGYLFAKSLSKYAPVEHKELLSISLRYMGKKYLNFYYDYLIVILMTAAAWIPFFQLTVKEWIFKVTEAVPTFLLLQMFGFRTADWFVPVWYVSAMMIVMFVLTPVMLRFGRMYSLYASPILSMLFLGIIFNKNGNFNAAINLTDDGINLGLLRAFAEISVGCTIYFLVSSGILKRFNKYLLSAVGLLLYIPPILYMIFDLPKTMEFTMILFIIAAVAITFQNQDTFRFLNIRFVGFLGKLSLPIFLCHSIARYYTMYFHFQFGYFRHLAVFLIMTLALSLLCLLLSGGLKKIVRYFSVKITSDK